MDCAYPHTCFTSTFPQTYQSNYHPAPDTPPDTPTDIPTDTPTDTPTHRCKQTHADARSNPSSIIGVFFLEMVEEAVLDNVSEHIRQPHTPIHSRTPIDLQQYIHTGTQTHTETHTQARQTHRE
eukprot:GHVQ01009056.1.p1 GENE.GHVQ01009056.1~~GHVQ01009056.1.p1  ORF type:complete len:145 (+),score=30.74 GHVQ01009056.1:66-437(+)